MKELFKVTGWAGLTVIALMNFVIGCFGINYISEAAHPYVYGLFSVWFLLWFTLTIIFSLAMVAEWIVELVDWYYDHKNRK